MNESDHLTCRFSRNSRPVRLSVLFSYVDGPYHVLFEAVASFFRSHEILISWRLLKGALHDGEFSRSLKLCNRRSSALRTAIAVSLLAGPGV